jgi:hypothetical protein
LLAEIFFATERMGKRIPFFSSAGKIIHGASVASTSCAGSILQALHSQSCNFEGAIDGTIARTSAIEARSTKKNWTRWVRQPGRDPKKTSMGDF